MALSKELTATQLLQGLQKTEPRLYDLLNIVVENIKEVQTTVQPLRVLSKSTTGGTRPEADVFADIYEVTKRISLRV
jgi:pimeloyl-CoA synthetase